MKNMQFKVNDLIINNSDHCGDVPIGFITKVTQYYEDDGSLYFKDIVGDGRCRQSHHYSVLSKNDLEKMLKDADKAFNEAKAKLVRLNEFKDHYSVKVGDKYKFTRISSSFYGAVFIVAVVRFDKVNRYSLIITEHTNDLGTPWTESNTDINEIFGSNMEHFVKI